MGEPTDTRKRFFETLHAVPEPVSALLEAYSGIPRDEQIAHITKVRDDGWSVFPFPCIGTFRFLDLDLSFHESYENHVLVPLCADTKPGRPEPLFLDVGTCMGQDLRKLIADGAPPHRLWGTDIHTQFIETGYALFKDADRFPRDHFLAGNLLGCQEDALATLNDKVTIIAITAVFHLFDYADQKRIADRCLRLFTKDSGAPVVLLGAQVGSEESGSVPRRDSKYRFQHNAASWDQFWREVCAQPGWSDKVASVETKSVLLRRLRNEEREQDDSLRLRNMAPDQGGLSPQWHQFTVWVTFK